MWWEGGMEWKAAALALLVLHASLFPWPPARHSVWNRTAWDSDLYTPALGADFYGIYEAGWRALHGIDPYSVNTDRTPRAAPYMASFRYIPLTVWVLGAPLALFQPGAALWLWLAINEVLLLFNLGLTAARVPAGAGAGTGAGGEAGIAGGTATGSRATRRALGAVWLAFWPIHIEWHMGQFSFLMGCMLFWSGLALWEGRMHRSIAWWGLSTWLKNWSAILWPWWVLWRGNEKCAEQERMHRRDSENAENTEVSEDGIRHPHAFAGQASSLGSRGSALASGLQRGRADQATPLGPRGSALASGLQRGRAGQATPNSQPATHNPQLTTLLRSRAWHATAWIAIAAATTAGWFALFPQSFRSFESTATEGRLAGGSHDVYWGRQGVQGAVSALFAGGRMPEGQRPAQTPREKWLDPARWMNGALSLLVLGVIGVGMLRRGKNAPHPLDVVALMWLWWFFAYLDVWEHHYVMLLPLAALMGASGRLRGAHLWIPAALWALPSLYWITLPAVRAKDAAEPLLVMLYFWQRPIGVLWVTILLSCRLLAVGESKATSSVE